VEAAPKLEVPAAEVPSVPLLSKPEELPAVPRKAAATLLVLVEALYVGIYLTALADLREASDTIVELGLGPEGAAIALLTATAAVLIPVRLYVLAAVCLGFRQLPAKFARIFPALLILDLLWALSPFLLIHHVSLGLALGMTAVLVYLPFAQRSLVLMYGQGS
jgi:cholera toxin transcriptional activator